MEKGLQRTRGLESESQLTTNKVRAVRANSGLPWTPRVDPEPKWHEGIF